MPILVVIALITYVMNYIVLNLTQLVFIYLVVLVMRMIIIQKKIHPLHHRISGMDGF